jgi:Alternative complex III, ActD subunit
VKAIYGLYSSGRSAQQAVNRLKAAGIVERDIVVMSAQPMEDFEFGRSESRTWMWWIACAGGLIGMATAFGLSWLTEMSWPINVGGLPTFAWWPNLIIIFELTMLGAILATVITLVISAGLGRRPRFYDPAVTDGKILVGVANPSESSVRDLESALAAIQGATVKTI